MSDNGIVFNTDQLNFWYGKNHALKNISLCISQRKVTAIIGPSGCGKSTFLKVLNRMVDLVPNVKHSGKVMYHGKNIFDDDVNLVNLRTRVGMVFQKPNPFPKSIFENVAFGPRIHRKPKKSELNDIVERSLRQAALWDEVKDRMNEPGLSLSGGQQQRLCIARTLANDPEVILMDEPTSALDPSATLRIEDLVRELRENYHIVIVTHNMQQAGRVSDETCFFLNGELVESDKTKTIFTNPKDSRTEDYISGRFA